MKRPHEVGHLNISLNTNYKFEKATVIGRQCLRAQNGAVSLLYLPPHYCDLRQRVPSCSCNTNAPRISFVTPVSVRVLEVPRWRR